MAYFKKTLLISLLLTLSACNEYWWTRGQPPSTTELLNRASLRVEEASSSSKEDRKEILEITNSILSSSKFLLEEDKLDTNKANLLLSDLEKSFKSLEGKLSYTNRPPFNELSGQLRAFKSSNTEIDKSALTLYTARVLFFLSSEISVPKPDPIRLS